MNVILIVFDSLRKDCIGAFGSPPWGKVHTPHFDAFAKESLVMTRMYPESLPTLPTRRALYTGNRVYPFLEKTVPKKGDFVGAPGWDAIPEEQHTLSEILSAAGYRTCLIADVLHMFKPSKNFWRGFDQWTFLRGQESDPARSGPHLTAEQLDYWLPKQFQYEPFLSFAQRCIMNMHGRSKEEDYFAPCLFRQAAVWLEQNLDADKFFLTIESFSPHELWFVPKHYRQMYLSEEGQEQVISPYREVRITDEKVRRRLFADFPSIRDNLKDIDEYLVRRTRANYLGLVTMCDRWFGYFMETVRSLGLLDKTMVIFTADHGHSIDDQNYIGKRGYPSIPSVYDVPLMIRFPGAEHAGKMSDMFVQHTDLAASILEALDVEPPEPIDGTGFLQDVIQNNPHNRNHVTVGWGSTPTVITKKWWLNYKVDGTGILLYDLQSAELFGRNVVDENPQVVRQLMAVAKQDAGGGFPDWLIDIAKSQADAPGCSDLVAR